MKFKKNRPKVNVLEHGDMYISPDFAPICPECWSENCQIFRNCGLETSGSWGHIGPIYNTREYYKEYICRNCKCRFRINEGRKIEAEWLAVAGILMSVLAIASIIVVAVIESG